MSGPQQGAAGAGRRAIPLEAGCRSCRAAAARAWLAACSSRSATRSQARAIPLDPQFPDWGDSRYFDVRLAARRGCADLLEHLFVLLPVLDDDKHYWVGADEVDKLLRRGGEWLAAHPERELIASRYLRHDRRLTRDALARLLGRGRRPRPRRGRAAHDAEEAAVERAASA